jgi:hypothetical protein
VPAAPRRDGPHWAGSFWTSTTCFELAIRPPAPESATGNGPVVVRTILNGLISEYSRTA